jgi:type IV pilus assembly protein PilC
MEKIAVRYEEETNAQINNIISIVEPSLVAVLSVIVGIILLSVMLPLMGIMAAIG